MEYETYADVIDAYNADNMGYSTLTDYIKGQNIKIKEISMEPLADLQKSLFENKADGGMIGIEVLFKEKMKDGGRAGFFMGGPALEGQALQIYNSMNAYGFSDQEIANALQERGLYTPGGSTQPEQVTGIINQQIQTGGDDGPKGDFGIFGNLDKSTAKDFNVEVYDEELGDFIPTTITGYKNVSSGLYQDKFGKNLQPAFSNKGQAFGLFGLATQALGLAPDTVGGYVPGSIRGKYDGIRDIFNKQKKQREDIVRQQQEEKARQDQLKKELEALAAQNRIYGSGGGRDESLNLGPGGSYTGRGDTGTPGLDSIDYDLKDGGPVGVATMFTRRR